MNKQRRIISSLMLAATVAALMGAVGPLRAQEPEAPVVSAPKIIEALTPKDITLDRPGQGARPGQPARDPSINLQVQFTFDSAELLPQGKRQLDELAMALNHKALLMSSFQLAGHTDRVGDADYNLRLSLARANAVKVYLSEVHGVSTQRLQAIGFGFARLLDPANPQAAINRRVEVRRVAMLAAPGAAREQPNDRLVPTPK